MPDDETEDLAFTDYLTRAWADLVHAGATPMPRCGHCDSLRVRCNGIPRKSDIPQFYCHTCKRNFNRFTNTPFAGLQNRRKGAAMIPLLSRQMSLAQAGGEIETYSKGRAVVVARLSPLFARARFDRPLGGSCTFGRACRTPCPLYPMRVRRRFRGQRMRSGEAPVCVCIALYTSFCLIRNSFLRERDYQSPPASLAGTSDAVITSHHGSTLQRPRRSMRLRTRGSPGCGR